MTMAAMGVLNKCSWFFFILFLQIQVLHSFREFDLRGEALLYERQRYDGWYNNMAHPEWGAVDNRLSRKTPATYEDGVYMMAESNRPSPRQLSEAFMKGSDGHGSVRNRTALLAFFGQVVTSEILMASEMQSCPIEVTKIPISRCDDNYDKECKGESTMPFYRAQYDRSTGKSPNMPREQKNKMTSWIDGSFIYSTVEPWVNLMRSYENGTLRMTEKGYPPHNTEGVPLYNFPAPHIQKPADPSRMYVLGDPRTNQNPALLSFGILFYRWHNVLARRVQLKHPTWSDEDIFQSARRLNIATLQNIIAYEYLPAFLGDYLAPYDGYHPDLHPGISHVFQSAAFRFGHTLIPPGIYRRDGQCNFLKGGDGSPALRLCSSWWDAQDTVTGTVLEDIFRGMSSQISEQEDATLCSDIRNKLFGPLDFSRRDLAALNIMRGRDSGLPDYNTVRKYYHLPRVSNWSDINPKLYQEDKELFDKLEEIYGDYGMSNIDLYIGGMLESNNGPGPLFRRIIKDQFERIRDADRFWFENTENEIFSAEEIASIKDITLWDVIVNSTDIKEDEIQPKVFFWMESDPCKQPKQLSHTDMKPCVFHKNFDYFQGSEMAYMFGLVLIVFFPLMVGFFGYIAIKSSNSTRRSIKVKRSVPKIGKPIDKMYVTEWLHQETNRFVKLHFGPDLAIYTVNRKGEVMRRVGLSGPATALVKISLDSTSSPMILVKSNESHDLVLIFESVADRKKFLTKLESLLGSFQKNLDVTSVSREMLLQNAETKETREKRLETFFREAYALSFGFEKEDSPLRMRRQSIVNDMSTTLTKQEFASALGMKKNDVFVKKMFNIVDKEKSGRISFQNFLDTVVLFTKGTNEDKLMIFFNMCDKDDSGIVDKKELKEMLTSLIEIAKTDKILDEDVSILINSMFKSAGIEDKSNISHVDFTGLMKEFNMDFLSVGLDFKGARQNFLDTSTNTSKMSTFAMDALTDQKVPIPWITQKWETGLVYLEENRQHIFYLVVFYVITIALFIERFMHYSFMAEHTDLRKIMGVGIAITRGAANSLTFCYCLLLLTVCKNLITKLKELSFHQYIPLDSHLQFHKICAMTALFFSIVHALGHLVNFYHVGTQPAHHLKCMSNEIFFPPGVKPDISYWLFKTMTGLTGLVLYCLMVIIFIFALPAIRNKAYKFFWLSHQLYVFLYLLCLVHGLARITQAPKFWMFFIFPGIVFMFDKVISLRRSYMELDILETELLPSDVIKVKFYRPPNYKFLSGQYIRASCTAITPEEFHSLTITSAPHEDYLSIHVKAVGSWTWKLRNYFDPDYRPESDPDTEDQEDMPKIRIQGPFGGGNQDWYKFEVAVMIGAGIGVTPYASILNDLVFGTSTNRYSGVACKKVYFIWICPSHRHFEWFIDVLREVERKDVTNVLEMHIFITQFFHKFDLRTTMLYICENHFQRLSKRSLFTGLKASNHFGRPDMSAFLRFVQKKHSYV